MTLRPMLNATLLLTLSLGCGSDDEKDTGVSPADADADTDSDADADADADADVDECEDQREEIPCGEVTGPANSSLSGVFVDESGQPYADATVQLCTKLQCKPTTTNASGEWSYTGLEGGCYAIDAHHVEDHTVKVLTFVELESGTDRVLDQDIVLYDYTDETDVAGETLVTAGDLVITANSEGYDAPFGHDGGTIVQSVQVDPVASGLPFDNVGGEVVGLWYLGPWSTELEPGWGITATGLSGISAGDTVQVLSGDYYGFGWDIAGEVTASADGEVTLTNADCGGVHFLSTLVLVKK